MNDWSIQALHTVDEVEGLEAVWRALTPQQASPFLTFAWNVAWYRCFEDAYDEIVLLVISCGKEVRGLLPAYRKGDVIRLAGDRICDY